jgi:hypothetical protein
MTARAPRSRVRSPGPHRDVTLRPRANAISEPIIGALRRELLDRLLIVNEHHLRQVLTEHRGRHYSTGRAGPCSGEAARNQARRRCCRAAGYVVAGPTAEG